jgi:hypothetical protein
MESSTIIGVKSTDNLWVYPLIGFDTYLMYERDKNIVSACSYTTGRIFSEKQLSWIYRGMDFEDFIRYSQTCMLCNLNYN